MGIKITSLPVVSLPYSGSEQIALVQSGTTKVGNLSSLNSYLSGALLADSELAALSGNWQSVSTTFRANSANYAVKNFDNNFSASQTFTTGVINIGSTPIKQLNEGDQSSFLIGSGYEDPFESTLTNSVGIGTDVFNGSNGDTLSGYNITKTIAIGYRAGNDMNITSGGFSDVILIGTDAGSGGLSQGSQANGVVCIGKSSGYQTGTSSSFISDSIYIGTDSGRGSGSAASDATNGIFIGRQAGKDAATGGGSTRSAIFIGGGAGNSSGSSGGTTYSSIAVGRNAGAGAAIGGGLFSDSIAIGSFAGYNAAYYLGDVSSSIMIGYNAGYSAGWGARMIDCVLLGTGAGANSTAGAVAENVIMIGSSAGSNSGNGFNISESIFIGLSSGVNQRGRRNTFIGSQTNTASTSAASLSGCIAIGHGARPSARNTIAIGSATTPLSVVPGQTFSGSLSGLRIMINGIYYTIPLLA